MASDDDSLRYCFAAAFTGAVPSDTCPPPEVLLAAHGGELPPDEVARWVDHLGACPVCAEAWRLLRLERDR